MMHMIGNKKLTFQGFQNSKKKSSSKPIISAESCSNKNVVVRIAPVNFPVAKS